MAVVGNGIRAGTVKAAGEGEAKVVALDNAAFNELISDSRSLREELGRIVEQRTLANRVQTLSASQNSDATVIVSPQKRRTFAAGRLIIRHGEVSEAFFFI